MHHLNETSGTLTLMGSGEMTAGMAEAHRRIMRLIDGPIKPVFIDTPAGFELNINAIATKAKDYFREQFNLELAIASFPHAASATPLTMERAMGELRTANYLFSGPGSPSYAARNWRGTPIFETMAGKLASGAQLVLASAATLSMGRFTIPVYEIYKVGEDPHWIDGLDLLGRYSLDLAIVPHWNNTSGGSHDTSHCFIGATRFEKLFESLPESTVVLGIDEYTACTLDLHNQTGRVSGAGSVTVQHRHNTLTLESGTTFAFDVLRGEQARQAAETHPLTDATLAEFRQALRDHTPAASVGYVHGLIEMLRALRETHSQTSQQLGYIELMTREMLAQLAIWLEEHTHPDPNNAPPAPTSPTGPDSAALLGILISLRKEMRTAKQYALADSLRDQLTQLNIELMDGPAGTTWRMREA